MALVVYWYDLVCFSIVGISFFVALYVLWRREGAGKSREDKSRSSTDEYERLLLASGTALRDEISDGNNVRRVMMCPNLIGHVSSSQLWRTCWRGLHPKWLLGLRLASLSILCGVLAWDIHTYDASTFLYYTEWTFTLVIIYFAIGTIISAHGCTVYYSSSNSNEVLVFYINEDVEGCRILSSSANGNGNGVNKETHYIYTTQDAISQTRAGFWGYLMQTAYQTCAGAVILTDIVFWCIIVPFLSTAHYELNMCMGCMHTLNAVLLLLDTSMNSLSFPWFRLAYFVLWSCCYVIFQWVIHACGFSWWPYPFLELSTPWAPVWYFSLAVVHIPCYGLYSLLVRAKNYVFPRLFPHSYVRSC